MTQKLYYTLSVICLLAMVVVLGSSFEAIKQVSFSVKWLGPSIVVFFLTYLSDVFLYFYYLKNSHLNPQIRYRILLGFRLLLVLVVIYFLVV